MKGPTRRPALDRLHQHTQTKRTTKRTTPAKRTTPPRTHPALASHRPERRLIAPRTIPSGTSVPSMA
jgi:hypothetical protein